MQTELINQHTIPIKILAIQLTPCCKANKTANTQTTPPIMPYTDPLAICAAFSEPDLIPTIMTAVNITAGKAANIPDRISHGEIIVTM